MIKVYLNDLKITQLIKKLHPVGQFFDWVWRTQAIRANVVATPIFRKNQNKKISMIAWIYHKIIVFLAPTKKLIHIGPKMAELRPKT